jgi:hypothetical protein
MKVGKRKEMQKQEKPERLVIEQIKIAAEN